jgi:protein TonB
VRPSQGFRDCLIEGDPAGVALARCSRAVSLCISVATQTLLLVLALVMPLVVTGERPRQLQVTPSPPYYGARGVQAQPAGPRAGAPHSNRHVFSPDRPIYQPPIVPKGVPQIRDEAEANLPPSAILLPQGDERGLLPPIPDVDTRGWTPPAPAPPVLKPAPPLRVSEGVQQARLLRRVTPEYPVLARHAGVEGTVVLRAIIARDGTVREIELLSGHPLLVQAAREAVGQWRYQPTLLNGEPVEVETRITVIFKLQRCGG